jgi:hypothetical protein
VRTARLGSTADTFYSVPATVTVKGRTVSGFLTFTGNSLDRPADPMVVKFIANAYGRNADALPEGAYGDKNVSA